MGVSGQRYPARWSEATRAILRLLGDGEWHTYDEAMEVAIPVVPPGKALRRYLRSQAKARQRTNVQHPRPDPTDAEKIVRGARKIANETLKKGLTTGHWIREGEKYRLAMEAPEMLVPPATDIIPSPTPEPEPEVEAQVKLVQVGWWRPSAYREQARKMDGSFHSIALKAEKPLGPYLPCYIVVEP